MGGIKNKGHLLLVVFSIVLYEMLEKQLIKFYVRTLRLFVVEAYRFWSLK